MEFAEIDDKDIFVVERKGDVKIAKIIGLFYKAGNGVEKILYNTSAPADQISRLYGEMEMNSKAVSATSSINEVAETLKAIGFKGTQYLSLDKVSADTPEGVYVDTGF